MAANLPSVVGRKGKQEQELNVANKYNKLQELENKRMKRKAALEAAMNKFQKDIA